MSANVDEPNQPLTEWREYRNAEVHYALQMLAAPWVRDFSDPGNIEEQIPDWVDFEDAFHDSVAHFLLAAQAAGLSPGETCLQALDYVHRVNALIEAGH